MQEPGDHNDRGNSPELSKMCVAGKLCPGANSHIDSQEMMTLSELIDRCRHKHHLGSFFCLER